MTEPKNISANEWLSELKKEWDKPPNSFTAEEAIKVLGLKKSAVREILLEKVKLGELKIIKWRRQNGGTPCNCYIPIKKKDEITNRTNDKRRTRKGRNDK